LALPSPVAADRLGEKCAEREATHAWIPSGADIALDLSYVSRFGKTAMQGADAMRRAKP
jgi:hypothetical protein